MIALVVGTLLAVAALAFVLYPLLVGARPEPVTDTSTDTATSSDPVDALREIESDHATGKLSDSDYDALRASDVRRPVSGDR